MSATLLSGRGTANDLTNQQRRAWSNLVLSVTQRCPLSCRHCITSSSNAGRLPVLGVPQAEAWAAEIPALAEHGLEHVTFTGGEPTLARGAVAVLAAAAAEAGIGTTIVTSGAFAVSPKAARQTVAALAAVGSWDFGWDSYHAEQMPLDRLIWAFEAVSEGNRPYTVRVCVDRPPRDSENTAPLVEDVRRRARGARSVTLQSVRRLGRASAFDGGHRVSAVALAPCVSTGPLVREDGSVAPCCSGLAYPARPGLPFRFGSALEDGLLAVWRAWREDQALRLMRLTGLTPVVGWLDRAGVPAPHEAADVCELCVATWDAGGRAATRWSDGRRTLPSARSSTGWKSTCTAASGRRGNWTPRLPRRDRHGRVRDTGTARRS